MKENKLYNGIRVKVWKMSCGDNTFAGGYKIENVDMYLTKAMLEISGGEPFESAFKEAELLAIIIDAELELNGKIIRKSIKGEYHNG